MSVEKSRHNTGTAIFLFVIFFLLSLLVLLGYGFFLLLVVDSYSVVTSSVDLLLLRLLCSRGPLCRWRVTLLLVVDPDPKCVCLQLRAIVFVFCRCHHYGLGTNLLCDRPVIILGDAPFLLPKIVLGSNQHVSIEIFDFRFYLRDPPFVSINNIV